MKLGEKLPGVEQQIRFLLRHDDASVEDRARLGDRLKAFVDAEVKLAGERNAARLAKEEADARKRLEADNAPPEPPAE